jgi:hypothetical protein
MRLQYSRADFELRMRLEYSRADFGFTDGESPQPPLIRGAIQVFPGYGGEAEPGAGSIVKVPKGLSISTIAQQERAWEGGGGSGAAGGGDVDGAGVGRAFHRLRASRRLPLGPG